MTVVRGRLPRLVGVARHVAGGALVTLPLAIWPGLAEPFSTPKLWLTASAALTMLVLTLPAGVRVPSPLSWLIGAWVASFVLSGALGDLPAFAETLLGIAAPMFAYALVRTGMPAPRVVASLLVGATLVAIVALLQWAGWDPIAVLGWYAPVDGASVRMRVYSTLGNPNFVGALMALTVPLAAAFIVTCRQRALPCAASVLSLVCLVSALVATGSRGAVLGLGLGAMTWAALRWSSRAVAWAVAALVVGTVAIAMSPARPLQTTFEGRMYLWQVVAPHATARPLVGQGPGAVALRFLDWQHDADARGIRDPRFRGLTDHVHNDYLEALVERGVPGLIAFVAPLVSVGIVAWRRRRPTSPMAAACAATVVAGAACALVDFPLARPVELVVWWTAVALVHTEIGPTSASGPLCEESLNV